MVLGLLFTEPLAFVIWFVGLIIAITVHEFAHAFVADKLGDPTPRYQGRVTLNPLAHLDPIGTIAILLTRFGWGKPVQFDPYNLKNPVKDTALIALAGPVSNILIAFLISLILNSSLIASVPVVEGLFQVLIINVVLAIFNLVPVHPLDGSKIIVAILPPDLARDYQDLMQRYGIFILLLLIFPWAGGTSPISQLIYPAINFVVNLLV